MSNEQLILWQDFETGGTNPWEHSPLSFAMIGTRGREVVGEWYTQIRQHPLVVTPEALEINKLDLSLPGFSFNQFRIEYFNRLNAWFYGGTDHERVRGTFVPGKIKPSKFNMPKYGGHNTFFDRQILQRILGGLPTKDVFDGCYYHRVDTMILASCFQNIGLLPYGETLKLENLCNMLGLEKEPGEFHNALIDLRMTVKAWFKMGDMLGYKILHNDLETEMEPRQDFSPVCDIPFDTEL